MPSFFVRNGNPVEAVINGIRAVVLGKSSLPTAQEWVEGGFDSMSAKETAAYIAIKGEDVSGKDALAFIKALGAVEGVEDDPNTKDDEKKSATWCKLEAIIDLGLEREDTMRALSVVMREKEYEKFSVVSEQYAISPEKYVAIKSILPKYNADGKGSYKNDEIEAALNSVKGLTNAQKGALWQMITSSKSAKNNPFSVSAGQYVLDNIK